MKVQEVELTDEQCFELMPLNSELVQMCLLDPEKRGVMLAQVFPRHGKMKVRIFSHDVAVGIAEVLWEQEDEG